MPDPTVPDQFAAVRPDLEPSQSETSLRPAESSTPARARGALRSRWLPWTAAVVLLLALIGVASSKSSVRDTSSANQQLTQLRSQVGQLQGQLTTTQSQYAAVQSELETVKASKIKVVTQTKIVTKTVPKWVPNGNGIKVETTGYEGQIEIKDVHLTRDDIGTSHVIGIAINTSGQPSSYAELGCTFLNSGGQVVDNEIDNKSGWPAGASWGFDCTTSGQPGGVTGAILRVDQFQ